MARHEGINALQRVADEPTPPTIAAASPAAKRTGGLRSVVFILVPYLLFCLIVEAGAYVYFRMTQPYRSLAEFHAQRPGHEYDPYRIIRLNPNHQFNGVRHDAQGFRRDTPVSKQKPPNTIRIFLMGGSAAYGIEPPPPFPPFSISNEETLDAQLERMLNEKFKPIRFEVINAAVVGYRVHIHWIYLNQVLLDYDPDIILFMDGHNDHYHASDNFDQWDYDHLALDELNKPTFLNAVKQAFLFAEQYSYAITGIYSRIGSVIDRARTPARLEQPWADNMLVLDDRLADLYRKTARRTWASIVRQNARLLQDHGVKAVVMLQPELLLQQSKPMSSVEEQLRELERGLRPPGHEQYLNFVKPMTVEMIQEALSGTGAVFVDLTDPFGGMREQAYIDYCHLSGAGFGELSRYLEPRIEPIISETIQSRGLRLEPGATRASDSPPLPASLG